MDVRIRKTLSQIRQAFIELRREKPLNKITVKELCEKANINKATFYLHYKSMRDLADKIENELIESCLASMKTIDLYNLRETYKELFRSFAEQGDLFSTLFFDDNIDIVIKKTDTYLKQRIYEEFPYTRNDFEFNIRFTATLYGIYYAFLKYRKDSDIDQLNDVLSRFIERNLTPTKKLK